MATDYRYTAVQVYKALDNVKVYRVRYTTHCLTAQPITQTLSSRSNAVTSRTNVSSWSRRSERIPMGWKVIEPWMRPRKFQRA